MSYNQIQLWKTGIPLAHTQLQISPPPSLATSQAHPSAWSGQALAKALPRAPGSRFKHLTIHLTNQECFKHNMTKDKLRSKRKPHSSSLGRPDIYSLFQGWTSGSSFSSTPVILSIQHLHIFPIHSLLSTPTSTFVFYLYGITSSGEFLSHPCVSSGANHITLIQEPRPD